MQIELRYVLVPVECTDEIGEAIALHANCCGGIAETIWTEAIKARRLAVLSARPADGDMVERVKRELLDQTFSDGAPMIVQHGFVTREMMADHLARAAIAAMGSDMGKGGEG